MQKFSVVFYQLYEGSILNEGELELKQGVDKWCSTCTAQHGNQTDE